MVVWTQISDAFSIKFLWSTQRPIEVIQIEPLQLESGPFTIWKDGNSFIPVLHFSGNIVGHGVLSVDYCTHWLRPDAPGPLLSRYVARNISNRLLSVMHRTDYKSNELSRYGFDLRMARLFKYVCRAHRRGVAPSEFYAKQDGIRVPSYAYQFVQTLLRLHRFECG